MPDQQQVYPADLQKNVSSFMLFEEIEKELAQEINEQTRKSTGFKVDNLPPKGYLKDMLFIKNPKHDYFSKPEVEEEKEYVIARRYIHSLSYLFYFSRFTEGIHLLNPRSNKSRKGFFEIGKSVTSKRKKENEDRRLKKREKKIQAFITVPKK